MSAVGLRLLPLNPSVFLRIGEALTESAIRKSVWATVPVNLLGGIAFAFPGSLPGRLIQVPDAPPVQSALLGFMILLFGAMYAWITWQPKIARPLLAFGGIGKLGVFLIGLALLVAGKAPAVLIAALTADLVFGSMWLYWLRSEDE